MEDVIVATTQVQHQQSWCADNDKHAYHCWGRSAHVAAASPGSPGNCSTACPERCRWPYLEKRLVTSIAIIEFDRNEEQLFIPVESLREIVPVVVFQSGIVGQIIWSDVFGREVDVGTQKISTTICSLFTTRNTRRKSYDETILQYKKDAFAVYNIPKNIPNTEFFFHKRSLSPLYSSMSPMMFFYLPPANTDHYNPPLQQQATPPQMVRTISNRLAAQPNNCSIAIPSSVSSPPRPPPPSCLLPLASCCPLPRLFAERGVRPPALSCAAPCSPVPAAWYDTALPRPPAANCSRARSSPPSFASRRRRCRWRIWGNHSLCMLLPSRR